MSTKRKRSDSEHHHQVEACSKDSTSICCKPEPENSDSPKRTPQQEALETSAQDRGHRLGNFHNYYAFHPPAARMNQMKRVLQHLSQHYKPALKESSTFQYCDLGCNEGALTLEVATALHQSLSCPVHFLGVDIDEVLIQRAKQIMWNNTSNVTGTFVAADICHELDAVLPRPRSVDLISMFSTTMWIHVHAGDEGLRRLLQQLCEKTRRFLLIEPQPSKCYRNATIRLRKLGRPELDVSSERLKMRANIEQEMEAILDEDGFSRVAFSSQQKTCWNRTLHLYERKDDTRKGEMT